jgi:hypothetical protein
MIKEVRNLLAAAAANNFIIIAFLSYRRRVILALYHARNLPNSSASNVFEFISHFRSLTDYMA